MVFDACIKNHMFVIACVCLYELVKLVAAYGDRLTTRNGNRVVSPALSGFCWRSLCLLDAYVAMITSIFQVFI